MPGFMSLHLLREVFFFSLTSVLGKNVRKPGRTSRTKALPSLRAQRGSYSILTLKMGEEEPCSAVSFQRNRQMPSNPNVSAPRRTETKITDQTETVWDLKGGKTFHISLLNALSQVEPHV